VREARWAQGCMQRIDEWLDTARPVAAACLEALAHWARAASAQRSVADVEFMAHAMAEWRVPHYELIAHVLATVVSLGLWRRHLLRHGAAHGAAALACMARAGGLRYESVDGAFVRAVRSAGGDGLLSIGAEASHAAAHRGAPHHNNPCVGTPPSAKA
jgi:hypothetical protein